MRQAGLFGLSDHLKRLEAHGDPLEELSRVIDFEAFRAVLVGALLVAMAPKAARRPMTLLRCPKFWSSVTDRLRSPAGKCHLVIKSSAWRLGSGSELRVLEVNK
jgi:hypothetical protein